MDQSLRRRAVRITAAAALSSLAASGAGSASAAVPSISSVDPHRFVRRIDNPYLPFIPGTRFYYVARTDTGSATEVDTVTHQVKWILGVPTVVVHQRLTQRGRVLEETYDWYAQDRRGNVWYFGEDTKEYRDGKVSTEGSWEAGKDGARPGIVMEADPNPGDAYRQEYQRGVAEDEARVLKLNQAVTVPAGSFSRTVETRDYTRLDPGVVEHKFYARGVGSVLEVTVAGGSDRLALVRVDRPERP